MLSQASACNTSHHSRKSRHCHLYSWELKSCVPFQLTAGSQHHAQGKSRERAGKKQKFPPHVVHFATPALHVVARDSFNTTLEYSTSILYHSFCLIFGRRGSDAPVPRLLSLHSYQEGPWPPIVAPRYGRQQVSHAYTSNSLWRSSLLSSVLALSNTGRVGRYRLTKLGSEAEEPLSKP